MKLVKGIVLALVVFLGLFLIYYYFGTVNTTPNDKFLITITTEGEGVEIAKGQTAVVSYKGELEDGTLFDQGDDFEFVLGNGSVIEGWEKGVLGMKVGEKRRLKIPSELGYGDAGAPPTIPGGATLIFEVELTAIK